MTQSRILKAICNKVDSRKRTLYISGVKVEAKIIKKKCEDIYNFEGLDPNIELSWEDLQKDWQQVMEELRIAFAQVIKEDEEKEKQVVPHTS